MVRIQPAEPRKQLLRFPLSWPRMSIRLGEALSPALRDLAVIFTGLSNFAPELSGKRLELLKETVSRLSRVAVFGTSSTPSTAPALKETELAAGALGVKERWLRGPRSNRSKSLRIRRLEFPLSVVYPSLALASSPSTSGSIRTRM
jgi:hypothetical protein